MRATGSAQDAGAGRAVFDGLLSPQSIAIIGASNTPTKLSGRPIDFLKRFGYQGRILPVNASRPQVQGVRAYADLDEIDGDIDLALLVVSADQVADSLRACARRGISVAIVCASGFAEQGDDGRLRQRELDEIVAETGIRVLGPNCMGMVNLRDRAVPTFTTALDEDIELREGPVAIVSQSGAFGSFIFSEAQHTRIGLSHYFSTGNESDVTAVELLGELVESDEVEVLLAYLEGVEDGHGLLEVARRANWLDKPIVVTKVGSSDAGARAARSHTGSLAGEDAVFDGAAKQHGMIRVDGMEPLLDAAQLLATGRRAQGRRLTTLSVSGGAGVLMADAAERHDIEMLPWDEAWQRKLAPVIPSYGSAGNPVDLTGTLQSDPGILSRALEIVIEHPDTHMIAVLLGAGERFSDALIESIRTAYDATDIPFVVVWTGGSGRPRRTLRDLGIPCYTDIGRAAAALGILADFSLRHTPAEPVRPKGTDRGTAAEVIAAARAAGRTQLDEAESTRIVEAYGVACAASQAANSPEDAVIAAAGLGGPVALKLLSTEIGHKSDVGGVRLGLTNPAEVRAAATDLLSLAGDLGVHTPRVLVQAMAQGETELILGIKHDPSFGPVVVVGLGGVLVDVLADSQVAVAPFGADTARRMLLALRGRRIFDELRGRPELDIAAVAEAISRLSWLAADFDADISELDVNPYLLGSTGKGGLAVDSLVMLNDS